MLRLRLLSECTEQPEQTQHVVSCTQSAICNRVPSGRICNLQLTMRDQTALAEYLRRRAPLTSIVSYPDRGPWGDNRYPGNCSGYLLINLCATYQPRAVL